MIKFESNPKENRCQISVCGDVKTLLAEIMYLVKKICDTMAESNEVGAEHFKETFLAMTADGLPFSIGEEEEEEDEEYDDDDSSEVLDKLIDVLREVLCS